MSISLSTINSYAGTGGVLLNAQQTGLESAGFVHRLKSFFNIGDAREKNRATLDALKDAVLTDPRFQTTDLMDEVERLFEKEHTCFAVDMSRIRGIMNKVGVLADKRNVAMLDKRVDMHMAAAVAAGNLSLTGYGEGYREEVTRIVKQQVRREATLLGKSQVDVAGITMEVCYSAAAVLSLVHESGNGRPPELDDFAIRNLRQFVVCGNLTLRKRDEIGPLVHDTCDFYWRAKAMDDGQVEGLAHSTKASANPVGPHAEAALKFMDTVGRPLKHGLFDTIGEYAREMSKKVTTKLEIDPTEDQVRSMVRDMAEEMRKKPIVGAHNSALFLRDNRANMALARYIGTSMALELSDETCQAICKSQSVETASEVFAQMALDSIKDHDVDIVEAIQAQARQPNVYPRPSTL